jgi:hypothetical protein
MNNKTTSLFPETLINLLAEDHKLARRFALLVIETTHEAMATADDVGGIANISVGDFEPIDVIVDHVDRESSQSVHIKLRDDRVSFRNVCSADSSTSLVGSIAGTDWIRIFVGGDGKPHLAIETGAVMT